jgi:hypothetical protein
MKCVSSQVGVRERWRRRTTRAPYRQESPSVYEQFTSSRTGTLTQTCLVELGATALLAAGLWTLCG